MKRKESMQRVAIREMVLLLVMFLIGFGLLPVLIFFVGKAVFGSYGDFGYAGFLGELTRKMLAGEPGAWFLVLSPYLGWQTVRATILGWRLTASGRSAHAPQRSGSDGM